MQVYVDLFFNNIEALLASAFPVAKRVLGDTAWRGLVRDFIHLHPSASPYFPDVSQEFLAFLHGLRDASLPGFLIELCHYEWVELGLAIAADPVPPDGLDPDGDLLVGRVVVSPLAWPLSYAYPVHRIGPSHLPEAPGERPTHLVVYRRSDDTVGFMEVSAATLRLLLLLDGTRSGQAALAELSAVPQGAHTDSVARDALERQGFEMLQRLRAAGILLGALPPLEREL
jgi:hypothetical protein